MSKLMAMKKDDEALTPRERTAVFFARKLTRDPVSVNDADYATLKTEFGDRGASDVVLQTCIRIYEPLYGRTTTAVGRRGGSRLSRRV